MTGRLGQALTTLAATLAVAAGAALVAPAQAAPPQAAPRHVGAPAAQQGAAAPYVQRQVTLGRSVRGRPIKAYYRGTAGAEHVLVVIGQMHGDERAGRVTAGWMARNVRPRAGTGMWVVPTMNPDGGVRGRRVNARGVDLNRNWPTSGWTRAGRGSRYWGGPRPASEPETRAVMSFLAKVQPDYIASIHQPLRGIGRNNIDVAWEKRLSSYLRLPRRYFGVGNPAGTVSPTMTGWFNLRHRRHGVATTIEYAARTSTTYRNRVAGRGIARAARVQ
jgi:murein tripeptide amidase MpaA